MKIILQVYCAIFSAIIQSFAIQNEFLLWGSPFLGLFSLAPLYFAFLHCTSFKTAGLLLSIQFTLTHVFSSFWLAFFKDFAALTFGGTVGFYTILGFFLGQLFYIPFWYTKKTKLAELASFTQNASLTCWNIPLRVLFFASLWTIYEWYKSNGFLGYPWVTILMTAWKWPLLTQIVSITGTWGLSFLFSLFSAVIAEGLVCAFYPIQKSRQKYLHSYTYTAIFCAILFTLTIMQGLYQYSKIRIPIKTVDTIIVQTNTDSWLSFEDTEAIEIGQKLTSGAVKEFGKKPDLIIWSEALLSRAYPSAELYYNIYPSEKPLTKFIQEINVPFIIGGPTEINIEERKETGKYSFNNAAQYYDKNGQWQGFYGKIHLVPFAEIIPYADSAFVQKFMQRVIGFSSGWVQGEHLTLFDIPLKDDQNISISTPICFEDAFPNICRDLFFAGSEAFFNITNDSWSMTNSAEIQHFVISSFRAQEFRTTLLRSTNSGYSVVVDPVGKILYDLPLFKAVAGGYEVPIFEREVTIYALLGDWLPILLLVVLFVQCMYLTLINQKKYQNRQF